MNGLVAAMLKSPLYWSFVLLGNIFGFVAAYRSHGVALAVFHGTVGVMAFAFWFATMGAKP